MILALAVVTLALVGVAIYFGARPEPRRIPIRVRDDAREIHRRR